MTPTESDPWDEEMESGGFTGGPRLDPPDPGLDATPEEWAEHDRDEWMKRQDRLYGCKAHLKAGCWCGRSER